MNPLLSIRKFALRMKQQDLAALIGCDQSTISRIENGKQSLSRANMQAIRDYAQAEGLPWNDTWFFVGCPAGNSKEEA